MFVLDAGYDPIALTHDLGDVAATIVVRIRDDRVFYTDPAPTSRAPSAVPAATATGSAARTRQPGQPRHRTTHRGPPLRHRAHPSLEPPASQARRTRRWTHHDAPPIVTATVIRVDVEHLPKPTARTKKTLWLWAAGPGPIDLDTCWRAYLRRFDIEHTFRFCKNTSGGPPTTVHPRPGRPVDLAHHRRLHPTPARPTPGRRPATALGETRQTKQTHPRACPARVSTTYRNTGHTGQPTKTQQGRPRPPQRYPRGPRTRHPAIKKTA